MTPFSTSDKYSFEAEPLASLFAMPMMSYALVVHASCASGRSKLDGRMSYSLVDVAVAASVPSTLAAYARVSALFQRERSGPALYMRSASGTLPFVACKFSRIVNAASVSPSVKSYGSSLRPTRSSHILRVVGMIWKCPSAPAAESMFLPSADSVRQMPRRTDAGTPANFAAASNCSS